MTTPVPGEIPDNPGGSDANPPADVPGDYAEAVEEFLTACDWLTPLDRPLVVHARAIARSLDRQMSGNGELQSALASSFDKAMHRLYARRPAPTPPPPGLGDRGPMGEESVFTFGLEET